MLSTPGTPVEHTTGLTSCAVDSAPPPPPQKPQEPRPYQQSGCPRVRDLPNRESGEKILSGYTRGTHL